MIIAVTLAVALPLAFVRLPLGVHVLLAVGAALLPLMISRRRVDAVAGHSTAGRAVWWLADGRLFGSSPRFMAQLAALERNRGEDRGPDAARGAGGPSELQIAAASRAQLRATSAWLWVGPLAAATLSPLSSWLFNPLVRVLNLSERTLVLTLDERPFGSVEPTTVESPAAGLDLYLPAGRHRLVAAYGNGEVVSDTEVVIRAGRQHLYAPGEHGLCFWLETTAYGRSVAGSVSVRQLDGDAGFWVLPAHVDSWFAPNPTSHAGASTSGGVLTALRQGPCSMPPAEPAH